MVETSDRIMGNIKGALKKTGQVVQGRTGIYATLSKEHGEVSVLLSKLVDTENEDTVRRQELFEKIKRDLRAHSRAEEAVFYTALVSHPETQETISHARKEHSEIETLLDLLSNTPAHQQSWLDIAKRLKNTVEHHVAEEEKDLFKRADKVLSAKEAKSLDEQYQRRYEVEEQSQV